jgi:hypothetical protein
MHRLILLLYKELDYVKITYIGVFLKLVYTIIKQSMCVYSVYNATTLLFLPSTHLTHDMFRSTWPSSGALNCPNCYTAFNSVQFILAILL